MLIILLIGCSLLGGRIRLYFQKLSTHFVFSPARYFHHTLKFLLMLFLVSLNTRPLLLKSLPNHFLQMLYLILEVLAYRVQLVYLYQHLSFPLFRLQSLAHAVGDWGLVESLVGLHSHFDFVTDPHKKETSFGAVDGNLTNEFVESLGIKFFSDGADASLSGLSLLQFLVQLILQVDHIDASRRRWRYILHPQLSAVLVLSGRQYGVEVVFSAHGAWFGWGSGWSGVVAAGWCDLPLPWLPKSFRNQNGGVILHQRETLRCTRCHFCLSK